MASYNPAIEEGKDIELPLSAGNKRRIANLQVYCYDEMIKRLNSVDKGKGGSVGYLLRRLWKRHESGLVMHDNFIYSEQHEQSQKANRSKFEKDHKKGEIGFRKDASGVWGVYSDWLYDTYQKDWSKAYQLTFWCFFRNMDYLSNPRDGEFFSYVYRSPNFAFVNPDGSIQYLHARKKHQFGRVIIKDAENLLGSSSKLNAVHSLPKHDKAVIYDILYGVAGYKGGSEEEIKSFMNGYGYWLGSTDCSSENILKLLSMDAFAHMASAAIVNTKALEAVKTYLPNSYKAFTNILDVMVLRLEKQSTDAYYVEPTEFKDLFYSFLSDCFPFREIGERVNFDKLMKDIYGDDACTSSNLDWLHGAVIGDNLPKPSRVRIEQMNSNILGAYRSNEIYINQQIASESLRSQEVCFILLLTLLHEYGHFLDDVLRRRAGLASGNSDDENGKAFAERFIRYSSADLFSKPSFEFADFKATDDSGNERMRTAKVSSLSCEQRMGIFCFFEYSEYDARGDLELLNGEIISNVEFFKTEVHEELTMIGTVAADIGFSESLKKGCNWQDPIINTRAYGSHLGENQHWHSMYSILTPLLSNLSVKERIIDQAKKWYEEAILYRDFLTLGKLCHMVQDSYCLSHCWRRYDGDYRVYTRSQDTVIEEEFEKLKGTIVGSVYNETIWNFQDYNPQDFFCHGYADLKMQKNSHVLTIGYNRAKGATIEIIKKYKANASLSSLENYLRNIVYVIYPTRENEIGGESHPWFKKFSNNKLDKGKIQLELENFSHVFEPQPPGMP